LFFSGLNSVATGILVTTKTEEDKMRRAYSLIIFFWCAPLYAQSNVAAGELSGTVTDATGSVVPSAAITVTNAQTGLVRNAFTDDRGEYRILSLPPGFYTLQVQRLGFSLHELTGIQVTVGQTADIDVTLLVGPVLETINVTADVPLVEIKRTQ
jgi:hypothetical protein